MPDVNGMPMSAECLVKLELAAEQSVSEPLQKRVDALLAAVIAAFQSPPGRMGKGGTGRLFVPAAKTNTYDGSGFARLYVDDMVPGAALSVSSYDVVLDDVVAVTPEPGEGTFILSRRQPGGYNQWQSGLYPGVFPVGVQNIAVTTTFGFAAQVPADVCEAISDEVAYRALVGGLLGVNGVGSQVQMDDFELSTSVGAINWRLSSPVGAFHDNFLETIERYRKPLTGQTARLVRRIS